MTDGATQTAIGNASEGAAGYWRMGMGLGVSMKKYESVMEVPEVHCAAMLRGRRV